jgi:hypothetical protein
LLAVPWYYVGRTIANAKPVDKPPLPLTGVVWGKRVFVADGRFAHWLHVRGASYRLWGSRHPHASKILTR